jgi:hypothetical protein
MRARLYIGSSPYGEDCAQVGSDDYYTRARRECRAFIAQLIRMHGEPPTGCRLTVGSNPHDFGTYYSVDAVFDDANDAACAYAYRCEGEGPELWDDAAREELGMEVCDG